MINDFTLDTDANPENMNKLIEGINKNEEDISGLKTSVEGVSSAIGQIANDRGYLNSKSLDSDIDLNKFFIQGKYYSSTCLNRPNSDAFIIDVSGITSASSAVTQKATCYYGAGNVNFGKVYERTYYIASGGWTAWKEIATETNTPIIKNVPTGVTKIRDLPMGIYQIYEGSNMFTDFPKTGQCQYGILTVTVIGRYKICSMILVEGSGLNTLKIDGFVDTSHQGSTIAWTGTPKNFLPIAATGITIISQNNYILNGVMYVSITVRKTDNSNFTVGVQHSICGFHGLTLTYPKNVEFTGWNLAGNILVGSGGVGTIFVDNGLYLIPTAVCGILRITGTFLLE